MKIVRSEQSNATIRKHLGTSCSTEEDASSLIAVKIADSLRSQDNWKYKNNIGNYVNDCSFDSHLSGAACPDHLFKGLITNVLTVCFDLLSDNNIRRHVDILVCAAVCDHKLPSIDMILSWDKHGKYNGINNMKTSSLFCALLFAVPIFDMIQGITTAQSCKDQASVRTGDHNEIASMKTLPPIQQRQWDRNSNKQSW